MKKFFSPTFRSNGLFRSAHSPAALALAIILLPGLGSAKAANSTWIGAGSDGNWSNAANWFNGVIPGSVDPVANNQDTVTFNGNTGMTVTLDTAISLKNLNFATADLGSVTIGSTTGNSIVFSTGGAVINLVGTAPSGVTATINAPIEMKAGLSFSNNQTSGNSALHIGGSIKSLAASGTQTITITSVNGNTSTAENIISGQISDGTSGGAVGILANIYGNSSAWTFSGSNTFTGSFIWQQVGALNANQNSALGKGSLIITSGGKLDNTSANAVTLANSDITINNNFTFGGTNDLSLGTGNVSLGTTTSSGFRRITLNGSNLTIAGSISNGTHATSAATQIAITGNGTGTLTLSGSNTHTGGVNVGSATLNINHAHALGTGALSIGAGVKLDNTSGAAIVVATNNAQTWSQDFTFIGTDDLDLGTGTVTPNAARTVTVLAKKLTVGGVINLGGINGLTKEGVGTMALSGANTYLGKTMVNAGTLLINGSHVDAANGGTGYGNASTGHFQVADGATLGGTGRIAGNTTSNNSNMLLVESGGTLAPGASIGTLVLDGANIGGVNSRVLNMALGSKFHFELAGDGSSPDQLHFWNYASGDLLLSDNVIDFTLSGNIVAGTYTVSLIKFYSDSGDTLVSGGITEGLILGTFNGQIVGTPSLSYNLGGNSIDITYTVVPEPGTWVLLATGLTAVGAIRRRKAA